MLSVSIVLLAISSVLSMFLSSTYFVLCLVFPIDIAIILRLVLHKLQWASLFHYQLEEADRVVVKVSTDEEEDTGLIQGSWHDSSRSYGSNETFKHYLFDVLTFLIMSFGSVMLIMGMYSGVGSTTAFPEAGTLQSPLFCALVALMVSLCFFLVVPLAVKLRWIFVFFAVLVFLGFFIPSCVVFPYNSDYHPIRVTVDEDYGAGLLTLSATDSRYFAHFKDSILSIPYFEENLHGCDSEEARCVFTSNMLFSTNVTYSARNLGAVGNNWQRLQFNFTSLPMSLRSTVLLKGDITKLAVLDDDGVKVGYNEAYWKHGLEASSGSFQVDFQKKLTITLESKLNYEYSKGIDELMCTGKNLMMDSYTIRFTPALTQIQIDPK
jgi:hypothetical protein